MSWTVTVPTLDHMVSSDFLVQDTQVLAFLCNKSRLLIPFIKMMSWLSLELTQSFRKEVRPYSEFLIVERGGGPRRQWWLPDFQRVGM